MPIAEYGYTGTAPVVAKRREAVIKKWRAMGCTESKIYKLIERRIRSKRQWW